MAISSEIDIMSLLYGKIVVVSSTTSLPHTIIFSLACERVIQISLLWLISVIPVLTNYLAGVSSIWVMKSFMFVTSLMLMTRLAYH